MKLPPPNHTQTPNLFFDDALPQIKSFAELKIILVTVRQTFGWHKEKDRLSISQFQKLTGMTRQGVIGGIERALADGFIEREGGGVGRGNAYSYKLAVAENGQSSRPKVVNAVDQLAAENSQPRRPTKETVKEKKEITAYAVLFDRHYQRIGSIPDAKAQGAAIKWILAAGHSTEKALACYNFQLTETWRKGHVNWQTVKQHIGEFMPNGNGRTYVDDVWEQAKTMDEIKAMVEA